MRREVVIAGDGGEIFFDVYDPDEVVDSSLFRSSGGFHFPNEEGLPPEFYTAMMKRIKRRRKGDSIDLDWIESFDSYVGRIADEVEQSQREEESDTWPVKRGLLTRLIDKVRTD